MVWLISRSSKQSPAQSLPPVTPQQTAAISAAAPPSKTDVKLNDAPEIFSSPTKATMTSQTDAARAIHAVAAQLVTNQDPTSAQAALAKLRSGLLNGRDRSETVSAIVQFLESGADAKTGLEFKVGPGHALSESPSLRVALLDWLSELDRDAAARYAQKVFADKRSADEWAVALRNYARGSQSDAQRLESWTLELLRHTPWRENPSAGFLEAFDTAVHLRSARFVPEFARLLETSVSTSLKHGAFVALDRLALAAPRDVLPQLAGNAVLAEKTGLRVALMARADVRDAQQLASVEAYLKRRDLGADELARFGGLFPNGNFFLSHNLLTEPATLHWKDSGERDLASLRQVRLWKTRGDLNHLSSTLAELDSRLARRVESAIRGGLLAGSTIGTEAR
jgi:hypothetical protein